MATLTNEQIEQKMQLLAEKAKEMKAISDELKNCDREMLSEEDLDLITGGSLIGGFLIKVGKKIDGFIDKLEDWYRFGKKIK